ncbi:zinc-dependent alcohol dehydrogenase [Candidatus Bathyarchaeota archaeon]|nr:zinc-dependent alcohol dehydrogenase [Candidatus Bathyarchaeota archaeon]
MAVSLPPNQPSLDTSSPAAAPIYKSIPVPKPGPNQVLVNIKYSGVCRTDLHSMDGDWPLPRKSPVIGGHEGAGVIVAKGSMVKQHEVGDNAGVKWLNSSCLSCTFCVSANEPLCPHAEFSGYTVDGTFQEYVVVDASHVARLPKGTDLAAVAPILCAGLTVYKALKVSEARPGQYVTIVGAGGGLGSLAVQYAKAMGLQAIGIDAGPEKGESCKKLGAASYVDFTTSKSVVNDVKAATHDGLGSHGVILMTEQDKPFQQAMQYVRSHGTVVCIGMPPGTSVSLPVFDTVTRMISVKGSYVGTRQDTQEAVDFFRRGLVKEPYKVVGLSELQGVYELMRENKITGRYVLDMSR